MVEASQVDWAGHANDIVYAMTEMQDFALTVEYLRAYVASNPDTLVVITADHSTGGLTLAANGEYRWSPEYINGVKSSLGKIAQGLLGQACVECYVEQQLGFAISSQQLATLKQAADQKARVNALKLIMDAKTNTGWTTDGHTALDVEVFAFGPGTQAFTGQLDNTDIAVKLRNVISQVPAAAMASSTSPAPAAAPSAAPDATHASSSAASAKPSKPSVIPAETMATIPESDNNVIITFGGGDEDEDTSMSNTSMSNTSSGQTDAIQTEEQGGWFKSLFGSDSDDKEGPEESGDGEADSDDENIDQSQEDEDECDFTTQSIC